MSERPVVCLLVDAFRHDYLDSDRSPYLARLADERGWSRMRPILGYSDSIRATIFTGAYPDEHGYWMEYCLRPEESPLGGYERLAPLDRFPSDLVKRTLKFGLSKTAAARIAKRRGYYDLSFRHFPFRFLGQIDWTLHESMTAPGVLGMPTIFDQMTDAGISWTYLDSARDGRRKLLRGADELDPSTRFVFVYLHHIDMASHVIGLDSGLFRRVVRRVDSLAEDVVGRIERRLGPCDVMAFSDHGMSTITKFVGFPDLWRHPAFPEQFSFALDATMIRLWHRDTPAPLREEIRERISSGAPGRFLEPDEVRELHLDLSSRLYGDEIYLLDPGVVVHPNFHSLIRPKAMHAYHPDDPDQQGIMIAPEGTSLPETAELVDVTAIVRRLTGVGGGDRVAAGKA